MQLPVDGSIDTPLWAQRLEWEKTLGVLHILMVEDSADDATLLIRELKKSGYELDYIRVETAEQMKNQLARQPWDIIIADYSLPQFSGLGAIRVAKESGLDIPLMIVSGTIGEEAAVAAMKAGAHDYITKDNLTRLNPAIARELADAAERRARKTAEQSFIQSEERYRKLFESVPVGVAICDKSGNVMSLNPAGVTISSYTVDEFREMGGFTSCVVDRQEGEDCFRTVVCEGKLPEREIRLHRWNGTSYWALISAELVNLDGQSLVLITIRDISESKKNAEALQESEARLRAITNASPDLTLVMAEDGTYIEILTSDPDLLYTDMQSLIGQRITEMIPDPMATQFMEAIRQTLEQGKTQILEYDLAVRAGKRSFEARTAPLNVTTNGKRMVVFMARDITERKQAEAVLQKRARQQAALADLGQLALSELDLPQYVVNLVAQVMDVEFVSIADLTPDREELFFRVGIGWKEGYIGTLRVPVNEDSQSGFALLHQEPIIVTDLSIETRFRPSALLVDHHVVSGISIVIGTPEYPFGVLGVHSSHAQAFGPDDVHFLTVVANILATSIARQKAHERINYQAHLLEVVEQAVISVDSGGKIVYWNPFAEKLYGWDVRETLGRHADEIFFLSDIAPQTAHINSVLASGESWTGEISSLAKDGYRFPAMVTVSPLRGNEEEMAGVVIISSDMTERKRVEARLNESNRQFRDVLETVDLIALTLDRNGNITFCNKYLQELTGWKEEELVGQSLFEVLTPHRPDDYSDFVKHFSEGTNPSKVGNTILTRLKEEKYISWSNTYLRNASGKTIGLTSIGVDETERHLREREMEMVVTISTSLRTTEKRPEMVGIILEKLHELLHIKAGMIVLWQSSTAELVVENGLNTWKKVAGTRRRRSGLNQQILDSKIAQSNISIENDLFFQELGLDVAGSATGIPLIAQQQSIGVLWVQRLEVFTSTEIRLLMATAEIAANAIYRSSLHDQTRRQLEHLSGLHEIDKAITGIRQDLSSTLNVVVEQVQNLLGVDACNILIRKDNTLERVATRGFKFQTLRKSTMKLSDSLPGEVVLRRDRVEVLNLHEYHGKQLPPYLAGELFKMYFGEPLVVKGEIKGVLEVFITGPIVIDDNWLNTLEILRHRAAIAIENNELLENLQRSNLELGVAYDATIETIASVLDMRENETGQHSRRTSQITTRLAENMGVTGSALTHIRRGALLHDIGKMNIPDDILLKPGKLTDEEWRKMKKHTELGFEMLKSISFLNPALPIVLYHHEKWDGTGYHKGLKGEQIPLEARIFAIVDVFDALTHARPYRKQVFTYDEARDYLISQSGKHFDPQVVEAFLGIPQAELMDNEE